MKNYTNKIEKLVNETNDNYNLRVMYIELNKPKNNEYIANSKNEDASLVKDCLSKLQAIVLENKNDELCSCVGFYD